MVAIFDIFDSRVRFSRDVDRGYGLRSMDTPNLLTSLSRTNLFKFSFTKRIVGEWNSLPLDIREASSVEDFKLKVSKFSTLRIFVYTFLIFFGVCGYTYLLVGL